MKFNYLPIEKRSFEKVENIKAKLVRCYIYRINCQNILFYFFVVDFFFEYILYFFLSSVSVLGKKLIDS